MHDLVEHAPVVFVKGEKVNFREMIVLGISTAVTALPQFWSQKDTMKSIAKVSLRMKWFASLSSPVDVVAIARDSVRIRRNVPAMKANPAILKPMRWLAHLPLAILPFLAAAIDGPRMQRDVGRRVEAALAASGNGWARVIVDGRDVEVRGTAPDRVAVDAARQAVAATFGVRRVDMRAGTALP